MKRLRVTPSRTTSRREAGRLGVALVASILVGGCASATPLATAPAAPAAGSTPLASIAETPSATIARTPKPLPAAIIGEFDAGGDGRAMTEAGGALWIQVDPPVDAIVRIDVATGSAAAAVPRGHKAKSDVEGLWVVSGDWLARIEPATGTESLRVPMGGAFALADGAVWLFNDLGLHRIDADTGRGDHPVGPSMSSVCGSSKDLVVAFESAWLACKEGKVVRIDLSSGYTNDIPTDAGSHTLAVSERAVWVTNYRANTVSRIDPETNTATTIADAGHGSGITSGGGYIWAATRSGIAKIDPDTATIMREIELGPGEYYELVWDEGIIWASTRGKRVLKVDPSKD